MTAILAVLTVAAVAIHRRHVVSPRSLRFIQAIQSGNLAEADRLLKIDPQLAHGRQHGSTSSSVTPLQLALLSGRNPKLIDRILQESPDLDEKSSNGRTAIHLAAECQMHSEVARLLKLGADPNAVDDHGVTPLHLAAQSDRDGHTTKLLLACGADPNKLQPDRPGPDGKTPLHLAAERGNTIVAAHLLNAGAEVNSRDSRGQTPLHVSTLRNHLDFSQLLVQHGADLTARDGGGQVPGQRPDGSNSEAAALIWWDRIVASHKQKQVVELDELLDAAPQVLLFRTEYSPATPLHRAVAQNRLDVLDYLLDRKMDPNVRGMHGQTALHEACWSLISVDIARRLLEAGADINAKDENGQTPMRWAARAHNHELLRMLSVSGADIGALE